MSYDLAHKHICLTGGTDGIGLALLYKLTDAGAKILVIGRRRSEDLTLPDNCFYFQADLSQPESPQKIADHINANGWEKLDYLIHNAGMGYVGSINDQPIRNTIDIIEVNLKSPIAITQLLFPKLERARGSVCFIGSTVSGRATQNFATYTATKTGIADFARNLATEWGTLIRVQEIHPGPTRTGFHKKAGFENPPFASLFMTPSEVADGIINALKTGKRRIRYGAPKLLYYAIKRCFSGDLK